MGRRRGGVKSRLGGGGGGNSSREVQDSVAAFTKAIVAATDPLVALGAGMTSAAEGVIDFGKKLVTGTEEWQRASAGLEKIIAAETFPAAQGLAGALAPTISPFLGGARDVMGRIGAAGSAEQQLEDINARAAAQGMPLDKEVLKGLAPLVEARANTVDQARRDAQDVYGQHLVDEAPGLAIQGITWLMNHVLGSGNTSRR